MTNASHNPLQVEVTDTNRASRKGWVRCQEGTNLAFSTERIESYCFAEWKPIVFDALLLTAAIEFCDRIRKRPTMTWGRDIQLRLPVHDASLWNNKSVKDSLHAAIELLTGDRWDISFYSRTKSIVAPSQSHFLLPSGTLSILPYSDGLDSRIVAGLIAEELGDKLIRVRLSSKAVRTPKRLGPKKPFTSVPYRVYPGEYRFVETSARSRGFKFAMLSGLACYLAQAEKIIVPESGQGALGPSLVSVGQIYEDYRNHPIFTKKMEQLLLALLSHQVKFEFPRLWHTKGETLKEYIIKNRDADWVSTRSCWQQSRQVSVNGLRRQCGICAACMLRRLSIHAAELSEAQDTYVWENLSSPNFEKSVANGFSKITSAQRQYAIAGTLHLDHLAGLLKSPIYSSQLNLSTYRLGSALGLSEKETFGKLHRLLNQHASEWKNFINSLGTSSFVTEWAINI